MGVGVDMTVCDRSGSCCTFEGRLCEFLDGTECGLFSLWGGLRDMPEWVNAPVGRWFTRNYPGFECRDWPQNIPEVMGSPIAGLCCWEVTRAESA